MTCQIVVRLAVDDEAVADLEPILAALLLDRLVAVHPVPNLQQPWYKYLCNNRKYAFL
jgi:hypothetical protein